MSQYDPSLDSNLVTEGDRFFERYNSKLHRALLPEGAVPKSINKRFADKRAAPRLGTIMPWRQDRYWYRSDNSVKFLGSFVYINSQGNERLILVPSGLTLGTQGINCYNIDTDTYVTISLPAGMTIGPNSFVWFCQGMGGQLIMLVSDRWNGAFTINHLTNGLFWNGDETGNPTFQWFTWNGIGTTQVIPPSLLAFPVSDRIAYAICFLPPNDNPSFSQSGWVTDHILISDLWGANEANPYQNMDPILQDFTINSGTSDQILSVIPYAFDTLIIGMKRSICSLANFSSDPTLATVEVLTNYMGVVGTRAMLQIGSDVYFMSERRGVFKLSTVLDKVITAPPLPLSDDIQPDIDRINWSAAYQIVFQANDNYLYIAAPIDGSQVNNAIFVFNLTTNFWETIDQFPAPFFRIDNLLIAHLNGDRRILAIQNGPPALVYLMYEGNMDQTVFDPIHPRFAPVNDLIETRGYGAQMSDDPSAWKTFNRGSVVMETLNPNVQITALTEGVNETKILRNSITKDPTKYYIEGVPDWKAGDDPLAPKRQDYTISGPPQAPQYEAQDFSQMPLGDLALMPNPQIIPDIRAPAPPPTQNSRERFRIRMTDRWLSLRIANTQGQCIVVSTSVTGRENRRSARTAA